MIIEQCLHYGSATLAIGLTTIGGGIGQGLAAFSVINAMDRQPGSNSQNFKALIIGLALIESGIVIAAVTALMVLFGNHDQVTFATSLAEFGIGLGIGLTGAAVSMASSFVVKAASEAISRQPIIAGKIITTMLLAQSIIEAPIIFSFIITLFVKALIVPDLSVTASIACFAAAIATGLGSIGPSIGQAIFAHAAVRAIGLNRYAYDKLFPFMLLNEAVIETPMIFCLLIGIVILSSPAESASTLATIAPLGAAITIGLGSLGTSTGIGIAASRSAHAIAQDPSQSAIIMRTTLLVEAFIESAVIYAMIIAMLLIMHTR